MSVPRGIVVVVALGYVIGVAGGTDISGQLPTNGQLVGMCFALACAAAAVSGFGKKTLDRIAQSVS